jgi:Uma2 family endonuclease
VAAAVSLIPRENRAISIAPDMAVEVICNSESLRETERKLRHYLEADVEVWQIFALLGTVTIWRGIGAFGSTATMLLLRRGFPVFRWPVSDFFRI